MLVGIAVFWLSGTVPAFTATDNLGGRFLPRLLSVLMILFSFALIVTGWLNIEIEGGKVPSQPANADASEDEVAHVVPTDESEPAGFLGIAPGDLRVASFILIMTIYTWLLPLLGYIAASIFAFMALIVTAGERRPLRVVSGAVGIAGLLYFLFAVIFGINLPTSSFFR